MTKVIVLGHGGYAVGMKNNLSMLLGDTEGFYFVDFNKKDNLEILNDKINKILRQCGNDEVLFACDLAGGSPFRQAAIKCSENIKYITVTGINTSAYAEIAYNLALSAEELAKIAVEVTRQSVLTFPLLEM